MPDAMKLNDAQIQETLQKIQGWQLKDGAIVKLYKFKDFLESMAFANRVATLAEDADHHPDILIRWNKVTLTMVTHSAGGLTEKDFALAQAIDG